MQLGPSNGFGRASPVGRTRHVCAVARAAVLYLHK